MAVALFLLAEVLSFSEVISQNWESFEIICNALMLGIAVFFSARELSAATGQPVPAYRMVWIEAVSLIAFPMNIDVFGHVIRLEQLRTDLWGWHSLWIACAILEPVILTSLGKQLLSQVKSLLTQLLGFLKWCGSIAAKFGEVISGVVNQGGNLIDKSDSKTLFTIIFGMLLWICWLVTQLSGQDKRAVLADTDFWGKNLLFWVIYLLVMLLLRLFPLIVTKGKEGIQKAAAKYVLAVIAIAVLVGGAVLLLPFVYRIFSIVLIILGLLIFIVKWAGKRDKKMWAPEEPTAPTQPAGSESGDENKPAAGKKPSPTQQTVRMGDLIGLLFLFVVLPLGTILFPAVLTPAGIEVVSGRASDAAAWLNFWNSILEITNGLLQLFRLIY